MSKIQNIPFELTLERLYKELYNNPYPILSSRKQAVLQVDFLGRFFPDRFYQDSARTENEEGNPWGKRWSNRNMRSAVWNGMYQSSSASRPNVFYRTIPDMIRRFPSSDFWRETLEKCDRLIANAPQTNLNRLRTFFEKTVVNSFNQKLNSKEWNAYPDSCDITAFQDYLKEHASSRPGLVLASVVLVALMGNMPSQALFEDMKSCVPSTEELAQIRNYLMPCGKQIRRSVWPGTQPPAPDAYADILKKYYDSYDTLYRCNTKVVRIAGDRRNVLFEPTAEAAVPNDTTGSMHKLHLLDLLYENAILHKESLVISGAPGTEKHGLLHMLFLRLVSETLNGDRVDYAPYLCNLWHYTALTGESDQEINAALKKDISAFLDFCKRSDRIPVVFIDGVKQYDIPGDLHLDYVLKESFSSL
ncbi:MAG: hypothetical protein VZQ75_00005, partial [Candidatus Faecousia sp.]|nr:hypothetical protein [Candidatus Faecousia sp.]